MYLLRSLSICYKVTSSNWSKVGTKVLSGEDHLKDNNLLAKFTLDFATDVSVFKAIYKLDIFGKRLSSGVSTTFRNFSIVCEIK